MRRTSETLFDKLWHQHRIPGDHGHDLLAIDRLLLHERTGGVALKSLAESGRAVRDPSRVFPDFVENVRGLVSGGGPSWT